MLTGNRTSPDYMSWAGDMIETIQQLTKALENQQDSKYS